MQNSECWQWKLRQRKEAMVRERTTIMMSQHRGSSSIVLLHEIDRTLLHDPVVEGSEEVFLGRGSFEIVKFQTFRGIKVAVKEVLPRTVLSDVCSEARILAQLSHPFVPCLSGVSTAVKPYRIVMQFHGIAHSAVSLTLFEALTPWRLFYDSMVGQIRASLPFLHFL